MAAGGLMDSKEFKYYRKKLNKTQKQMAHLLGTSIKAIHSYEQGWRTVPPSVERQIFFLVSRIEENRIPSNACWTIKKCSPDQKAKCPAWEFKVGKLCWFINGTICEGSAQKNWKEKMRICRSCEVLPKYLKVTASDQVLDIINRSKKGVNTATLMKKTGFDRQKVRNILQRSYKQGKIKRAKRGVYIGGT
jgi:DNA-binding XRE family transcriptional regulator